MKILLLWRYVGKTVFLAICMSLLLLVGLDSLGRLISENNNYIGEYNFPEGILYVLLLVPSTINEYVPFSCLLGCLMGLGSLATNSELVVLRSSGVSTSKIVGMALVPALFVLAFDMVLQEWVSPEVSRYAETRRHILQYGQKEVEEEKYYIGIWFRDGQTFLHINVVDHEESLHGITAFEFSEQGTLQKSLYAKTGKYEQGKWVLYDIAGSEIFESHIQPYHMESEVLDISLTPALLEILVVKPDQLPPSGLFSYMQYLQQQKVDGGEYQLAFWKKMFQPLAGIALVLVAASFIFGPLRQSTTGYRVFLAVIVGIVFNTTQDLLGPSSLVFGFQPWFAILLPILVYMAIGFYLLRRSA